MVKKEKPRKNNQKFELEEQKFKVWSDIAPVAIYITDKDGNCTYANKTWLKHAGMTMKQAEGKGWKKAIHPEDQDWVYKEWHKSVKSGGRWGFKYRFITKKGKVTWVYGTAKEIKKNGKIGYIGTNIDISDAKEIEKEIEKYKIVIEESNQEIAFADLKGNIIFVNKSWAKNHGHTEQELIGRHLSSFHTKDELKNVQKFNKILRQRGKYIGEVAHKRRDGSTYPTLMNNFVLKVNGKPAFLVGMATDISEKRAAEEKLKAGEEKYKSLFDSAGNAIFILGFTKRGAQVVECNSEVLKIFKCKKEQIIGLSPHQFSPTKQPDGTNSYKRVLKIVMAVMKGETKSLEWVHRRFDGVDFEAEVTVKRVDIAGKSFLQAILKDISERKKTEKQLMESEDKYRNLIENSNELIQSVSNDGKFLYVNNAWYKTLGYSKKDLTSLNLFRIISPKSIMHCKELFKKIMIGEEVKNIEAIFVTKTGKEVWLRGGAVPRLEDGKVTATQGYFHNITKIKEAENKLIESEEKLAQANNMLHLVLDSIPSRVFWKDRDSVYIGCNKAFAKDSGLGHPRKLIGKNDHQMGWKEQADMYIADDQKVIKSGKSKLNFEEEQTTPKGNKIWLKTSKRPLRDSKGNIIGMVGVYDNISKEKEAEIEIRKAKETAEQYLNLVANIVVAIDCSGKITLLNDAGYKILGYNKDELIGKNWFETCLPRHNISEIKGVFKQCMDGKTKLIRNYENSIITKKGEQRLISWRNSLIKDRDGKIVGTLSSGTDITKEKIAQVALAESEEKYRILVERANDGIVILQDRKIMYANPRLAKMLGYSLKGVIGLSFAKFIAPSEYKKVAKRYAMRMAGKKIISTYDTILQRKNKSMLDVEINAGLIDYGGRPADLILIRDISERKKTETELMSTVEAVVNEKEKIDTIVQSIADAVFVVDTNGKIVLFNNAASKMSGYTDSESLGKKYDRILNFVLEDQMKKDGKNVKRILDVSEKRGMSNHTVLINKDDDQIPVSISSAPLKGGKDEVIGSVIVFRDVSKERQIDKMKTEFVSVASHQLRTPLSGIKWFTELLLKEKAGKLNEEQKDFIEQVYLSNDRLIRLVSDLLDVSHIETGRKFSIEKKNSDLVKILNEVLEDNQVLINKRKIKIIKHDNLPQKLILTVDTNKIQQVFNNVISNAVKYSKPGGQVEIGIHKKTNKEVSFFVKDNGFGIPKKQQYRVFEKFFRSDNVMTTETDGTGLGLYIAKAILEAHKGKIWFESKEGKGSVFYISLPRKQKTKK